MKSENSLLIDSLLKKEINKERKEPHNRDSLLLVLKFILLLILC